MSNKKNKNKKEFEIYTDGACDKNGYKKNLGGWGFVFVDRQARNFMEQVKVVADTTNNRMEMLAVLNVLQCVWEHKITSFVIYSDSQYVVNGFNEWMMNWERVGWQRLTKYGPQPVANVDLWKEMFLMKKELKNVDLRWVKGHNGNQWNEYIDERIQEEMYKHANGVK